MILGTLGTRVWHRCRACGIDYSTSATNIGGHCPMCWEEEVDETEQCDECEEGLVTDIHNDPVRFCDCAAGLVAREAYEASVDTDEEE